MLARSGKKGQGEGRKEKKRKLFCPLGRRRRGQDFVMPCLRTPSFFFFLLAPESKDGPKSIVERWLWEREEKKKKATLDMNLQRGRKKGVVTSKDIFRI